MTNDVVMGIVAGVLGVCLLGIVGALIFNPTFRRDLAANPGRVSLFGASIEGVVIVLITGALIMAMVICANIISNIETLRIQARQSELAIRITQLPSEVSRDNIEDTLHAINENIQKAKQAEIPSITLAKLPLEVARDNVEDTLHAIYETVQKAKKAEIPFDIISEIKKLTYSDRASATLRTFPSKKVGPWSLAGNAREFLLSVPKDISEGKANWCRQNVGLRYEVRSRLEDSTAGSATIVQITNPITVAENCPETQDFLQVTCSVASRVFGPAIVTCDNKGQPEWKIENNKKLPIWITTVAAPD